MIGVVIEQAFMSRRALRQPAPVRLRRLCTLTCKPLPGVSAMHVDVQPPLPSSCAFPWRSATHVNVQSSRHPLRQRVLHVDVQSAAAHVAGELHVDVQSHFLLFREIRPDSIGATEMGLHVNVQRLRRNRQRWAGTLSPHSKQKASRQLRPRQNLGLSHFEARK